MTVSIKAPQFPESISEGTVAAWHKGPGDAVQRDELLVDIETDKVVLEVVAPSDGQLTKVLKAEGDIISSEEILAQFEPGTVPATELATEPATDTPVADDTRTAAAATSADVINIEQDGVSASPAARKLADERSIDIRRLKGTGRDGRITKDDVAQAVSDPKLVQAPAARAPVAAATAAELSADEAFSPGERIERRVPMTRLRASIAKRLVEAQHTAAMLTTFNEVDMSAIMDMRKNYQEAFQKSHNGTRLGFMSFFVRAAVEALKRFPAVNASIDGNDIVYHGYYDIGVAVSTERGLVVPVIRNVDALSLAQVEDHINEYGMKAKAGKLAIDDMTGGTFTISNGGIFGSMLSTPILNPPQTGILGMHNIQQRAVVINGEIVARPMMYLALSYDHRVIDGQEAVRFLVTMKEMLEDPARMLLEL